MIHHNFRYNLCLGWGFATSYLSSIVSGSGSVLSNNHVISFSHNDRRSVPIQPQGRGANLASVP